MRRTLLILILTTLVTGIASAQKVLSINDFEELANLEGKKSDNFLAGKGFVRSGGHGYYAKQLDYAFEPNKRLRKRYDTCFRYIAELTKGEEASFTYQTSSQDEYRVIIKDLQESGFWLSKDTATNTNLFQKNDMSINVGAVKPDSILIYNFRVSKTDLPKLSGIQYAEDLSVFQSHENLVHTFGSGNVKRDVYYFEENRVRKCSVLYPNSSRQVIFMWDDEDAMNHLAYLIIGGSLRANGSMKFNQGLPLNDWQMQNGIRIGMNLQELKDLAGEDYEIYGNLSEFQGVVVPVTRGSINFRKTGVQMACLNCYNNQAASKNSFTSSYAIENNIQMYVLSILVMPNTEKP